MKRSKHSCFYDQKTNSILVMGGQNVQGFLDSTEIWTIGTDTFKISSSSTLPKAITHSASVPSNSEEYVGYIAGGFGAYKDILGLKRVGMNWVELESKSLYQYRGQHSLLNIPLESIPGC